MYIRIFIHEGKKKNSFLRRVKEYTTNYFTIIWLRINHHNFFFPVFLFFFLYTKHLPISRWGRKFYAIRQLTSSDNVSPQTQRVESTASRERKRERTLFQYQKRTNMLYLWTYEYNNLEYGDYKLKRKRTNRER